MCRRVDRNLWLIGISCLVGVIGLGVSEPARSQTSKAKTKGKATAKTELSEDLAKYVAPLTGDESPIAADKTITVYLNNGKVLADMKVSESLLGTGEGSLKFLSVADTDGKKETEARRDVDRPHSLRRA